MHKFSTAATTSSALPVLRDPQAGAPGLLNVPYSTFAGASVARLFRSALSSLRDKNLCIIRPKLIFLLTIVVLAACGGPERIVKLPVPRADVLHAYRLMAEGDEMAMAGQIHFALLKYLEASRLNPYHEVIFNKLAIAYSRLQQFRQAERAVERAIRLEPDYAFAHNTRGIVYLANRSHKRAIDSLKEAIKLKPDEANFYVNLGHAYLRDENYKESLRTYQKALEIDPEIFSKSNVIELSYQSVEMETPERFYQMARIFAELGNKESCLEYLGKAFSAGFSDGSRLMSDTAFQKFYQDSEFMDLINLYGIEGNNS